MALDDLDVSVVEQSYLYQALQHWGVAKSISGSAQPQITRQSLSHVSFPFPPLDEQRRIAEVLRSVDEAIAAADGVICQLRETRGHRLEALMTLPGAYRRIDEICRLSGGSGFPIKHQGKVSGRYPFAKVSDMNRLGNEVQMRHAENYVDDADIRTLKAKTFPVGTTFFPKVGATLLTNKRRIAAVEMLVDNNVMGAVATSALSTWRIMSSRVLCPL
jgi:type I restriction enzyme S subunit